MTDAFDLAAMIADREAGTPGPWEAALERGCHGVIAQSLPEGGANFVCMVGNDTATPDKEPSRFANARRIARVPEMEAEILRLRAEVDALEAKLAERVTVKPLVWEYHPAGKLASDNVGKSYIVDTRGSGVRFLKWPQGFAPDVETLDQAKVAAQADYNRRIFSAITTAPLTPAEAAKVLLDTLDEDEWRKSFIKTLRAIAQEGGEESVVHTCQKCGGTMRPGQVLQQTYVGDSPDFPGDTHATTFHAGGPGVLTTCLKCEACGWSVTKGDRDGRMALP